MLEKAAAGIAGFDEITGGGLPRGRPTLSCGGAGCCKPLFGLHFLVRGAVELGEPGVFIAFEEREQDPGGRPRIRQRPVTTLDRDPEEPRERVQVPVSDVRQESAGESNGAQSPVRQPPAARAQELGVHEPPVEAGVVGHERGGAQEREELVRHLLEARGPGQCLVRDPRQA